MRKTNISIDQEKLVYIKLGMNVLQEPFSLCRHDCQTSVMLELDMFVCRQSHVHGIYMYISF